MRAVTVAPWLILGSIGCRTVVPLASPAQDLPDRQPRTLLLADSDHSVIRMTDARLMGDTVVGLVNGHRKAVPLSGLSAVQEVHASPGKTVALAMAVGGAVVAGLVITHPWSQRACIVGVGRLGPNGEEIDACQ